MKNGQKKSKGTKSCAKTANHKPKASRSTLSDLEFIEEEAEGPLAVMKQRRPVPLDIEAPCDDITDHTEEAICPPFIMDCPEVDMDDGCDVMNEDVIKSVHTGDEPVNLDKISQLITKVDEGEDIELQAMFYLPKWDSAPPPCSSKLCPESDKSLKVILASVAELLSRSPPSLTEDLEADMAAPSLPPSPLRPLFPQQPFKVSFSLDVDDDDDDDDDNVMIVTNNVSLRMERDEPPVGKEDSNIYHKLSHPKLQQSTSRGSVAADSPTWDEVFEEEEVNENHDIRDNSKETDVEEWVDDEIIKSKNEGITEEKESWWGDERNEEMPDFTDGSVKEERHPRIDDSMDLFGDDEAFLQMTIPDISTPGVTPRTSPSGGDVANATKTTSDTLHTHNPTTSCSTADSAHRSNTTHTNHMALIPQDTNTHGTAETKHNTHTASVNKHVTGSSSASTAHQSKSSESSHDYFSVNFDLGYSLEDSEEEGAEEGPAPCASTSPQPKEQAVSDSSTPYNSCYRPRIPPQSNESKLSTPQMLSEHRKGERSSLVSPLMSKGGALPSPITPPGPRRTLMSGDAGPRTPSSRPSLKRRRLEVHTTEAERAPSVETSSHQESVFVVDPPPHAGWLILWEI